MIQVDAMFPVMVAKDLVALKDFYETMFGFKAVFYDPSFYLHLVSPQSGIQLGFLVPNHASQPSFLQPLMDTSGYVISFEVKDAATSYAEAQKQNLNVVMDMKDESWGQRHFMVQDPAGFKIDIVQHMETK